MNQKKADQSKNQAIRNNFIIEQLKKTKNIFLVSRFMGNKCCIQLRQVMGKVKPARKFPCFIKIHIFLMEGQEALQNTEIDFQAEEELITYDTLCESCLIFLEDHNIRYQTDMFTIDPIQNIWHKQVKITNGFEITVSEIEQSLGTLFIFVKNRFYEYKLELEKQIQELKIELRSLREVVQQLRPIKENIQFYRKNSMGVPSILAQTQSLFDTKDFTVGQIDLGVLFSEPLYNEDNKPTASAVDFRSEISRLKTALEDSYTPNISMRCQIGRSESLRNIIRLSRPKILHIICHGSREGYLEFEDNSVHNLGLLNYLKPADLKKLLKDSTQFLPELVFVNSCHSQKIGRAFFELGVKIVVMINSEDLISDEASQIFSENFYRNIFKGETIQKAFQTAKQTVQISHYSYGCCCNHSGEEIHRLNCRWMSVVTKRHPNPHKDYHVPSSKCKCPPQLRNFNRHKDDCQWARKVLFQVNNDFRIKDDSPTGFRFPKRSEYPEYCDKDIRQFVICCCPQKNRKPHSESYKFKCQIKEGSEKTKLYDIVSQSTSELVDLTPAQLLEAHMKSKNIYGRQAQLYQFLKAFRQNQMLLVYGRSGVGLTTFTIKASAYAMQRKLCQFFFFIDLYEIKDEIVFRFKFNEITGFKYNGNINENGVKNRRILILLDNCDDFLKISPEQFYKQIHNLKKQLPKSKFIFNIKEQNLSEFDLNRILCCKFELLPLQYRFAVGYLTNKLKDKTDITVGCQQFKKLVNTYEILKIPKVVESLSQSFSDVTTKITFNTIVENVQQIGLYDESILVKQVLDSLKQKSNQAYEFLIFVSQFSQGISFKDLDMFSSYDYKLKSFNLPIKANWRKYYELLLHNQSQKQNNQGEVRTPSLSPKFQTHGSYNDHIITIPDFEDDQDTTIQNKKIISLRKKSYFSDKSTNDGQRESYFIQKAGHDKFIVKRFLRDFVWNKYLNYTANQMKFLYVIYFSVILQMLFESLTSENLVHEQLITSSTKSKSGIFNFQTNLQSLYPKISLTDSTRIAHRIMSGMQQIFIQNASLLQKLKKDDPICFIIDHKQDFLKIYDCNWTNFIAERRKMAEETSKKKEQVRAEINIFLCLLENLMIEIPTALKIASKKSEEDSNLIKYAISRSSNQLDNLKNISTPHRSLTLHLKIYMIEASFILQTLQSRKVQQNRLELNKIKQKSENIILKFHEKLKGSQEFYQIKRIYHEQINNNMMYLNLKLSEEKDEDLFNRIQKQLENWKKNKQLEPLLMSKQVLLIAFSYLHFLTHLKSQIRLIIQKKNLFLIQILQICKYASRIFSQFQCQKLQLRCDLVAIQIFWQYHDRFEHKNQLASPGIYKEIDQWRVKLIQCQNFYLDERNKLEGFTQFDDIIKTLKKQIKQKLWKSADNSIIFMRAYPLYTSESAIINNLVRKKNPFRKDMQMILSQQVSQKSIQLPLKHKDSSKIATKTKQLINLDISTKFQILTRKKIDEETQTVCSVMLLSCDFKVVNDRLYMVVEGEFMNEDLIQIDYQFAQKFRGDKIYILVLTGQNSKLAMLKISSLNSSPPAIIALNQTPQQKFDEINMNVEMNSDWIRQSLLEYNEIKQAELIYTKYFIKKITRQRINKKQQIKAIHEIANKKLLNTSTKKVQAFIQIRKCSDFYIAYKKGCYRDLSPRYQRNHNINQKFYDKHVILRRWKKMIEVLKYLKGITYNNNLSNFSIQQEPEMMTNHHEEQDIFMGINQQSNKNIDPKYINIYGDNNCGKSYFIKQIAKLLIERQLYDYGVFLFEGKKIQQKYSGDFQAYINNQRKINKMPVLQDFDRIMGQNMILIIDDFHLIKPRSNARMKIFIDKILQKKVNLILVSNVQLNLQWLRNLMKIKIQKIDAFQIEILAYNLLNLNDSNEIEAYQKMKRQLNRPLTIKQVTNIIGTNKDMPSKQKKGLLKVTNKNHSFQLKKVLSSKSRQ